MNIELEKITLCIYDNSEEHNNILLEFDGDSKSKYIHEIKERIKNTVNQRNIPFESGFLIKIDNQIIGYMFISKKRNDEVFLEYSILKKYRGKKYSTLILNEVSNYLMNEHNIRSIALDIDPSNLSSIRSALSAGYEIDEEEYINRKMEGKILYRLDNYNYINRKRK